MNNLALLLEAPGSSDGESISILDMKVKPRWLCYALLRLCLLLVHNQSKTPGHGTN